MKTRTTISIDKDVLDSLKDYNINISSFCEEQMKKMVELLDNSSMNVANEIYSLEEEKNKIELALYRVLKHESYKLEAKNNYKELHRTVWKNFIEEFEEIYYGLVDVDLKSISKATGVAEHQLMDLGTFIYSFNDENEYKLRNDLDYAIMRYNEENKSNPIRREV